MLWIEAQWTTVIALLVFGVCYMLTASIACLAVILSRRAVAKELKAIAPVLTPLCVVLGLLIGFLAARVWTNLDRANQYVGQEAGALRDTILLSDALPSDVRTGIRQAVKKHLDFIEFKEWPAMASGRAKLTDHRGGAEGGNDHTPILYAGTVQSAARSTAGPGGDRAGVRSEA